MINWQVNELGLDWADEQGRSLCSRRDPIREAGQWVESLNLSGLEQEIAVVGTGAFYHLFALRESYPKLKIIIYSSVEVMPWKASRSIQIEWQNLLLSNVTLLQSDEAVQRSAIDFIFGPVIYLKSALVENDLTIVENLLAQSAQVFRQRCQNLDNLRYDLRLKNHDKNTAVNIKSFETIQMIEREDKIISILQELIR